jgi:predicted helicase
VHLDLPDNFKGYDWSKSQTFIRDLARLTIKELQGMRAQHPEKRINALCCAVDLDHCVRIAEQFDVLQPNGIEGPKFKVKCVKGVRGIPKRPKGAPGDAGADQKWSKWDKIDESDADILIQVKKLGEGYNNPSLAICTLFRPYRESGLREFIQNVGRIMRVTDGLDVAVVIGSKLLCLVRSFAATVVFAVSDFIASAVRNVVKIFAV